MIIATMYSETMIWKAIGNDEAEAKTAILTEWNQRQKHMSEIGYKKPHYYSTTHDLDEIYGIEIDEIEPGHCIVY